ncbi:ABC transporter substrate-binding protein [Leucobacter sp. CSA1]|uniref:ABC transporter substrate-binding protein n=1 Tax=Leucobacter chromiisoli TaxID=2796471 RepID=A0A934Q6C8_9MICO|nr:ABC transporter substrate-binding protein [Leucobacter chromiisoli]MBK0417886.1 ABC transporter substrate-binding protein [Leucobacter chromiisoli]
MKRLMTRRGIRAGAGLALALGLVGSLAACAGSGDDAGGDGSITLGFPGGIGPTDVPAILALESLAEEGVETDYIEFDSPDVQTQALLRGDVNVASMGPATVMSANIAKADIRMVANNNMNDLQIIVAPDVGSCEDLAGQPVAIHSEGSTSTAHLKRWYADECPDADEPEWLVISGSENRATALLEGQIMGTVVRLEDWIGVTGGESDQGKVLTSLSDTQSDLLTQTIAATQKTLDDDAEAVSAFLDALGEQFDAVNSDPQTFAEEAARILEGEPEKYASIYEELVAGGAFPDAVGLDPAAVEATIAFYQESGSIPEGELTVEDVADTEFAH